MKFLSKDGHLRDPMQGLPTERDDSPGSNSYHSAPVPDSLLFEALEITQLHALRGHQDGQNRSRPRSRFRFRFRSFLPAQIRLDCQSSKADPG